MEMRLNIMTSSEKSCLTFEYNLINIIMTRHSCSYKIMMTMTKNFLPYCFVYVVPSISMKFQYQTNWINLILQFNRAILFFDLLPDKFYLVEIDWLVFYLYPSWSFIYSFYCVMLDIFTTINISSLLLS